MPYFLRTVNMHWEMNISEKLSNCIPLYEIKDNTYYLFVLNISWANFVKVIGSRVIRL